jgi:Ca2+-binding EF-hand superfamily protein
MPRPKPAAAEQPPADQRETARARPERERADRPGDKQRPGLEEFQRKVLQEFRSGDRNGDGYLSRDEVQAGFAGIEREFKRVDADGDGRISPEEFWRMRRFQAGQRFKKQ